MTHRTGCDCWWCSSKIDLEPDDDGDGFLICLLIVLVWSAIFGCVLASLVTLFR